MIGYVWLDDSLSPTRWRSLVHNILPSTLSVGLSYNIFFKRYLQFTVHVHMCYGLGRHGFKFVVKDIHQKIVFQ